MGTELFSLISFLIFLALLQKHLFMKKDEHKNIQIVCPTNNGDNYLVKNFGKYPKKTLFTVNNFKEN